MKRIISFALATFFIFMSVFSTAQMDVRAAIEGTWNQPISGGYQYIKWKDSNKKDNVIVSKQTIAGVYQGSDNKNFAKDAPIASIYIAEDMVHQQAAAQNLTRSDEKTLKNEKLIVKELWKEKTSPGLHDYLMVGNTTDYSGFAIPGNNYLMFDQTKARTSGNGLSINSDNYIDGNIISYTFVDAAEYDGKKADVVITYSNLHIVLQHNIKDGLTGQYYEELDKFLICSGNDVRTNATKGHTDNNQRYGIKVDAKVQVLDKNGNSIKGIFYFKSADIDVYRSSNANTFGALYDAGNNLSYSEQVRLNSGVSSSSSYKIYLPGGTEDENKGSHEKKNTPAGYKARIKMDAGGFLFQPQDPETKDEQFSIYSGFLTAIDNEQGASVTVWSSAASLTKSEGKDVTSSVETYLLAGNAGGNTRDVWYNLKSTTGVGGKIQTTTNGNQGANPGTLKDGGTVMGPTTITVSGGRTVTYTMKADSGFVLDFVKTADDTLDYATGSNVTVTTVSDPSGDYYTFTFSDINMDHAIHVEWKDTNQYKDTYSYSDPGLPSEVTATLPAGTDTWSHGDSITPAAPSQTEVIVGDKKYIWDGWDKGPQTIDHADVAFVGKWRTEPYSPSSGGGGGSSSSTPPATDPVDPVTPPVTPPVDPATEPLPEIFVPSTESDGSETTDGTSGLTVPLGEAEELTIKPVLPAGVIPGPVKKVSVAGAPLTTADYKTEGDAIILLPAFLNKLPEGTYTVRIVYENAWTEAQFGVLGARRPSSMGVVQGARTGDITYGWPVFFAATGASSAAALLGLLHRRKRMK